MFSSIINSYRYDAWITWYINTLVIVLGLVIGSFLNVVGLRFLAGESIVLPPSKCPKCNTKLKWYDNIPILSYILLLGKCRYCKCKISIQYPIVEAACAGMFLLIFFKFGFALSTLLLWILAAICIVMCITDFREQIIFDCLSIPMIPLGLIYSFFNLGNAENTNIQIFNLNFTLPETFISSIIGMIIAFTFFEIISLLSKLIIKQRAFGEGDTIIAMIFAAWFGYKILILTIVLAFLVQVLFTLPLMLIKLFKMKDKIAIISFFTLLIVATIPILLKRYEIIYNGFSSVLLFIFIMSAAIISALIFLKRMRELNSYTLLPFGPALIVAGFISLFFFEKLSKIILF